MERKKRRLRKDRVFLVSILGLEIILSIILVFIINTTPKSNIEETEKTAITSYETSTETAGPKVYFVPYEPEKERKFKFNFNPIWM